LHSRPLTWSLGMSPGSHV